MSNTNSNKLEHLSTDYLFDKLLPAFVNVNGELYHFKMIKGRKGPLIMYKTQTLLNKEDVTLGNTHRSDSTLRGVAIKMILWLNEFGYSYYMPYGYRERYKDVFESKFNARPIKESRIRRVLKSSVFAYICSIALFILLVYVFVRFHD